jgi:glycine/D-amino acid oxidase-like deaminating enzyme
MSEFAWPPSLWAATAAPAPDTPPLAPGEHRAEAVVIGGGVTGLSTALALAERGAPTMLLEAAEIGWGASGRNNGQVIPTLSRAEPAGLVQRFGTAKGEALARLVGGSASYLFDLVRKHGIDCEAVQAGWVQPAHTPGRVERVSKVRVEQWRRLGFPAELLDREQVAGITGSGYWYGGWRNPTGGHVDPLGFTRGLARAAQRAGALVHTRSPVTGLERTGDAWRVQLRDAHVIAKRVVVATNAYSGEAFGDLARSIVTVPSYQMATEPLPAPLRDAVLPSNHAMSDTHGDLYFARRDARGRLVTGGALVFGQDFADRLRLRIGKRLAKLWPALHGVRFDYVWQGKLSMTRDRVPHFHRLGENAFAWLGCNGRAVALGTALGPVLAEAVLGARDDALPVPVTRLGRIPAHGVAQGLAPFALLGYRWRDLRG